MNSLNESNCCRTKPFSSKKAEMTVQASSCHDNNEKHTQKEVSCCDHPPHNTLSRERGRTKKKSRDTFREREPSSLVGLIVVLSFDERERETSLSLSSRTHGQKNIRVIWQFAQQREVETTSDDDDDEDDMM